ncbi:MAG: DUF2203 domain-containing protein [Deltaproteobacteria bacterium]|nr:DUF2203 domain-containing protein [Deltaproteobacteria bacterium]
MAEAQRFTIEEANALIPRLEMLMADAQRAALTLRSAMQEADDVDGTEAHTTKDVLRVRPDLADDVHRLEWAVAEIEALGCQFKGLDLGLVDFPAQVDGTTILLCWQYGEKEIAFWHRTDEGFANRRALTAAERPSLQ